MGGVGKRGLDLKIKLYGGSSGMTRGRLCAANISSPRSLFTRGRPKRTIVHPIIRDNNESHQLLQKFDQSLRSKFVYPV